MIAKPIDNPANDDQGLIARVNTMLSANPLSIIATVNQLGIRRQRKSVAERRPIGRIRLLRQCDEVRSGPAEAVER